MAHNVRQELTTRPTFASTNLQTAQIPPKTGQPRLLKVHAARPASPATHPLFLEVPSAPSSKPRKLSKFLYLNKDDSEPRRSPELEMDEPPVIVEPVNVLLVQSLNHHFLSTPSTTRFPNSAFWLVFSCI